VSILSCLLQLGVLLAQSFVEVRYLGLVVSLKGGLLLEDDLVQLVKEGGLVFSHGLCGGGEDLAQEFGQVGQVLVALGHSFLDVFVDVPEVALEVLQFDEAIVHQVLLSVVVVFLGCSEQLPELVRLLVFTAGLILAALLLFLCHLLKVLGHALLAHRFLADVDDRFRKVLDANVASHLTLQHTGSQAKGIILLSLSRSINL
jgi:hypothetical protein